MNTRRAILLFVIITCATCLVAIISQLLTQQQIEQNHENFRVQLLSQVLSQDQFDNDLLSTQTALPAEQGLSGLAPITVYRARKNQNVVAVIFDVTTQEGYSGRIRLLVGVGRDGEVTGVRITEHRETPGLGDKMEPEKSDWIFDFSGKTLEPESDWQVKKQGGAFDAWTGATITPSAIVKTVAQVLKYVDTHQSELFNE